MKKAQGSGFYQTHLPSSEAVQWLERQIPQFMMKAEEKSGKLAVELTFHDASSVGNTVLNDYLSPVPSTTHGEQMVSVLNVMNAHRYGPRLEKTYRGRTHSP